MILLNVTGRKREPLRSWWFPSRSKWRPLLVLHPLPEVQLRLIFSCQSVSISVVLDIVPIFINIQLEIPEYSRSFSCQAATVTSKPSGNSVSARKLAFSANKETSAHE